jgi:hypothetical protein
MAIRVTDARLRVGLAGVITVLWSGSIILDAVNPNYDPPASLHPLMLIVACAVFGEAAFRARRNGNGATADDKP